VLLIEREWRRESGVSVKVEGNKEHVASRHSRSQAVVIQV